MLTAVRLRPWNGDLSLLRGTHHDPDLSRPEVQPEQRCCIQRSASGSCLSRSESRPLTTARRPLTSPASAGLFYGSFAFRIGLFGLPTFKPNGDGEGHTHGKASTNQHHTNFHRHQHHLLLSQIIGQDRSTRQRRRYRPKALLNQRLIRLIDASKRLSRTTEIGMVLLHQFSMRLLDLSEGRVGLQAQHP